MQHPQTTNERPPADPKSGPHFSTRVRSTSDSAADSRTLDERMRAEASGAISAILTRSHSEWSRTFGSIKQVLDGLQHACDTVLGQPLPDITGPVGELAARTV